MILLLLLSLLLLLLMLSQCAFVGFLFVLGTSPPTLTNVFSNRSFFSQGLSPLCNYRPGWFEFVLLLNLPC